MRRSRRLGGRPRGYVACCGWFNDSAKVLRTGFFHKLRKTASAFGRVAADSEKNGLLLQAIFVTLGFEFGHAKINQIFREVAYGTADAEPGKTGFEGAFANERAETGKGQHTEPCQNAESAAENPARRWNSGGLVGQFRFQRGVVRESGNVLRQQNGNIRGCDAGSDEFIGGGFGGLAASVQRKDGQ